MSKKKIKHYHLKKILHRHRQLAYESLHKKHRHLKKIFRKHKIRLGEIRQKGVQAATTSAIVGTILTTPGAIIKNETVKAKDNDSLQREAQDEEKRKFLDKVIKRYGPKLNDSEMGVNSMEIQALKENFIERVKQIGAEVDKNNANQYENELTKLFYAKYNIQSSASLGGNRLNTYYGFFGREQHLPRYPGDSAAQHLDDPYSKFTGITSGRGAWGWWTNSKSNLSAEQTEQEKYYIAAQTFLAPGWREKSKELSNWFKYRKVIVVNPNTGKACVAVIGDAGPASWTGKSFGGSPELMNYMNMQDGKQKEKAFVFFVDDPENKILLGPVEGENVILASN